MYKNILVLTSLLSALISLSKGQILIGPYVEIGDIQRQGDLKKVLIHKPNIKKVCFYSDQLHKFEYLDTISRKRFFVYDSVPYIPDSIILLKKLRKLSITGNKFRYISPNLSKLKRLRYFNMDNFGRKEKIIVDIPILPHVRYAVIASSDSTIVKNTLKSLPNIKSLELHFEAQWNGQIEWNAKNMLSQSSKLKTLIVPYWEGLAYASKPKIDYIMEQDTVYKRVYYLDFDLSHCKHLRKIVTDYDLSDEMRRYCRKHFISVVKFSRKRFWKKE